MLRWTQCSNLGVWLYFCLRWWMIYYIVATILPKADIDFYFFVNVSLGPKMDFWLDSHLIGTVWCHLMVLDGVMFGFRSCFRTLLHHSMAGLRDSLWHHPMASLSWLDGFVDIISDFRLLCGCSGAIWKSGWFSCWHHGVLGTTREIGWVRDAHSLLYYLAWSIAAYRGTGCLWGQYGLVLGASNGSKVGIFRLLLLQ